MLKFITGGAGTGKSEYLMREAKRLAGIGKKIIYLVPEQFSFESDRKLYRALGSEKFNRILSLSFSSLARDIFRKYGGRSGEYAEDIHKYILMNKAVRELYKRKDLSCYLRQAKKASFVNDALSIVSEFRQCGITPEELSRVELISEGMSEKLKDISMIYASYDRLLKENDLKDSLSDISEAGALAAMNDIFKGSIVFMDEFESFTGDEYEMIETMLSQCEDMYIALRLEKKVLKTRSFGVFASVEKTYKSFLQLAAKYNIGTSDTQFSEPIKYKSADLAFLNRHILRNDDPVPLDKSDNIKITECRDMYEEADFVCASIKKLVREEGCRYRDIAVISRQLSDYLFIIEAACDRYDIPYFLDTKKSACHTLIMQMMLSIVNVLCNKKTDTEMILKYIKTSFSEYSLSDISELENYCYEWGIEGSKWFEPFSSGTDKKPHIEKMRETLMTPVKKYRKLCRNASGQEVCRLVYEFMFERKIPLRVADMISSLRDDGFIFEAKEQMKMWDSLMNILDTFSKLDSEITVTEFTDIFSSVVQNMTYSLPPQRIDNVQIANAQTVRVNSPKAVFVLGANEGFFPMAVSQSGLLSDKDRLSFKQAGLRLSRDNEELVSDEKLVVYKSLTYAVEKLFITYPISDNSGSGRFPSSVIKQVGALFKAPVISSAAQEKADFFAQTPASAYYTYVRNFGREDVRDIEKALMSFDEYASKIKYLKAIAENKDLEIKEKELMKKLYTKRLRVSPTGLEDFNHCHFKYFCKSGLELRALKKRVINALEQGNIVHKCLETVLSSCATKEEFDSLTREKISELADRCADEYVNENIGEDLENDLRNIRDLDAVKQSICGLILHLQSELRQSEFRPVEFEYKINADRLPILRADNGIEIVLSGTVDRVDMLEEGGKRYIRVIDYKTGNKKFDISTLRYGINMQMLVYLFTITGGNEKYSGSTPAGVLYMPSGDVGCERDRDDDSPIESYYNKSYRMNGVILKDRLVLSGMEKDIAGIYIPAKLKSSDTGEGEPQLYESSSVFSERQFKNLKKFVSDKIKELADKIYSGCIESVPHSFGGASPCSYCDYSSICGGNKREIKEDVSKDARKEMEELLERM